MQKIIKSLIVGLLGVIVFALLVARQYSYADITGILIYFLIVANILPSIALLTTAELIFDGRFMLVKAWILSRKAWLTYLLVAILLIAFPIGGAYDTMFFIVLIFSSALALSCYFAWTKGSETT